MVVTEKKTTKKKTNTDSKSRKKQTKGSKVPEDNSIELQGDDDNAHTHKTGTNNSIHRDARLQSDSSKIHEDNSMQLQGDELDQNGNAHTDRARPNNTFHGDSRLQSQSRHIEQGSHGYSTPTIARRPSLTLAEMHIQKMPVILDDRKQMAVWTDIKEIIFPSCSESLCDIVLTVIKEIVGYPEDETNASPCTPKQQMAFLRNFRIVPCGTLLVNTRIVQEKIIMLKNLVRTRHLTSEEVHSRECHYWKEHANHDHIISPDQKVTSEFQQMKAAANNKFCWCVLPLKSVKEKFKSREPDPIIYNGRNLLPAMKLGSIPYVPMLLVYPYFNDVYSYLFDLSREHLLGNRGNITKCLTSLEANCLSSYIARQQGWGARWHHITSRDLMIDWQQLCKHVKNPPTLTVESPDFSNNVAMVSPLQMLYDTEHNRPQTINIIHRQNPDIKLQGQNTECPSTHKGGNAGCPSTPNGGNTGCPSTPRSRYIGSISTPKGENISSSSTDKVINIGGSSTDKVKNIRCPSTPKGASISFSTIPIGFSSNSNLQHLAGACNTKENNTGFQSIKNQNVGAQGTPLISRIMTSTGGKLVKMQQVPFEKLPQNIIKMPNMPLLQMGKDAKTGQMVSLLNSSIGKMTHGGSINTPLITTISGSTPSHNQELILLQEQPTALKSQISKMDNLHGTLLGYNDKGQKIILISDDPSAGNNVSKLTQVLPVCKPMPTLPVRQPSCISYCNVSAKSQQAALSQEFDEETQFTVVGANETVYTETSPVQSDHDKSPSPVQSDHAKSPSPVQSDHVKLPSPVKSEDDESPLNRHKVNGEDKTPSVDEHLNKEESSSISVKNPSINDKKANKNEEGKKKGDVATDIPFFQKTWKMPSELKKVQTVMEEKSNKDGKKNNQSAAENCESEVDGRTKKGKRGRGRAPNGKTSASKSMVAKLDHMTKSRATNKTDGKPNIKEKSSLDKSNEIKKVKTVKSKTKQTNGHVVDYLSSSQTEATAKSDNYIKEKTEKSSPPKTTADVDKLPKSDNEFKNPATAVNSSKQDMPAKKSTIKHGKVSDGNIGNSSKPFMTNSPSYPFQSSKRPIILPVGKTSYDRSKVKSRIVPSHNADVVGSILDDCLASQRRLDKLTTTKTSTNHRDVSRDAPYREILFDSDDKSSHHLMKLASASPFAPDSACTWRLLNLYDSRYVTQLSKNKNQVSREANDESCSQKDKDNKTNSTHLPVIAKSCELLPSQEKKNMGPEKARKSISTPLLAAEKAKYSVKCDDLKLTFTKIRDGKGKLGEADKENVNCAFKENSSRSYHGDTDRQDKGVSRVEVLNVSEGNKKKKDKSVMTVSSADNAGNESDNDESLPTSTKKKLRKKKQSRKSGNGTKSVTKSREKPGTHKNIKSSSKHDAEKYKNKQQKSMSQVISEDNIDNTAVQDWNLQGSVFVLNDNIGEGNQSVLRRSLRSVLTPQKTRQLRLPGDESDGDVGDDQMNSCTKKKKLKKRRSKRKIQLTMPLVLEKSSSDESLYDPKLGTSKYSEDTLPKSTSFDSASLSSVDSKNASDNICENTSQGTLASCSSSSCNDTVSDKKKANLKSTAKKLKNKKKAKACKTNAKLSSAVDEKEEERNKSVGKVNYEEKVIREQERILEIIKKRNAQHSHQLPVIAEDTVIESDNDHNDHQDGYQTLNSRSSEAVDSDSSGNKEISHDFDGNDLQKFTYIDENNNLQVGNFNCGELSAIKTEMYDLDGQHDSNSADNLSSSCSTTSENQDVIYILHSDHLQEQLKKQPTGDRNFFDWAQVQFDIDPKTFAMEGKGNVYILTTCESETGLENIENLETDLNNRTSPPPNKTETLGETSLLENSDLSEADDTLVPQTGMSLEDIFNEDETLTPAKNINDMDEARENETQSMVLKYNKNMTDHVALGITEQTSKMEDVHKSESCSSASVVWGESFTSHAISTLSNTSNVTMSSIGSSFSSAGDVIGVESLSSEVTGSNVSDLDDKTDVEANTGDDCLPNKSVTSVNHVSIGMDANGIRYLPDFDEDTGETLSGLIFQDDIMIPYVLVNGYKYTLLRDVLPLFSKRCHPKCILPKKVLKNFPDIPKTFCTWDQVFLLDQLVCSVPRGAVITGEVIVRYDKLITMREQIQKIIADKHRNTRFKNSQDCQYATQS